MNGSSMVVPRGGLAVFLQIPLFVAKGLHGFCARRANWWLWSIGLVSVVVPQKTTELQKTTKTTELHSHFVVVRSCA